MSCWHSQTSDCAVCNPLAAPEMPEGWTTWENSYGTRQFRRDSESPVSLDTIRALLATQGLRIIGKEGAAVLDVQKTATALYQARGKALATEEPSPEWDAFDAARVAHYNACAAELAIQGDEE